ncbi:Membrane attack complex component/perforin/complement C9 [Beggiatoa sp. PS]|nr:Membrane attack complex component/perforin/complement C9 [Beggiatoa sp. PS]
MPLSFLKLFSSTGKNHNNNAPPAIIGLDMVGRGLTLRPHQTYELKEILFKRIDGNRVFDSVETAKTYLVPDGYEVNESPPIPADKSQCQLIVEDSWEEFEKHLNIDAQVAASHNVFSVDVKTGQTKPLRPEEDSYYALRTFFIPFWTLYLPDVTDFEDKKAFKQNIPTPFQHRHRKEYEKFFDRYGTHYIKRAWIGGKAMLIFSIAKSTGMTKQDIRKGLNACYALTNEQMLADIKESLSKLHKHSECLVLAQGGEATKLGALSLLDEARYSEWLATVKENPKVVEFEAAGIWTLLRDENKAKALWEAYRATTIFTPFSAIFGDEDKRVYFIRGKECTCYHLETHKTGESKLITDVWPSLLEIYGFDMVDTMLKGTHIKSCEGNLLTNKLFLFKGSRYVRLDMKTKQIDEGYPKLIAKEWPGVTFDKIDATLSADSESLYFFRGNQYIRYNLAENKADPDYPKLIKEKWDGITFDRIDAAIALKDGRAYLFSGNQYICYDMIKYRVRPGYPKCLMGNYIEDWNLFD